MVPFREIIEKYRIVIISLIIIFALPTITYATFTKVNTGTKVICKYSGHIILDSVKKKTVFRWTASQYRVRSYQDICPLHKRLEALYAKAKEAERVGDLAKARSIFQSIKRADPNFKQVIIELAVVEDAIRTGKPLPGTPGSPFAPVSPGSPGGTSPGGIPGSPDSTRGGTDTLPGGQTPVFSGELASLFPKSLAGYTPVTDSFGQLLATRQYKAENNSRVYLLVISIRQLMTDKAAEDWIKNNTKWYYAADARNADVSGVSGYFGTDGKQFAVLAYQINGIVFEIEMLASSGVHPRDLYSEIVAVGSRVP